LSFGGVPATLVIPLAAIVAFADPFVRYGMRFRPEREVKPDEEPPAPSPAEAPSPEAAPQVVSLDAFRRRPNKG
jgi:hypothetical protein